MKLLVDMNLSPSWINVLADAGIEAAHWSKLGACNAPDSEIMAYASPNVIGKQVIIALHQMAAELEEGALLTVDPNRTRLRVLPLQPRN